MLSQSSMASVCVVPLVTMLLLSTSAHDTKPGAVLRFAKLEQQSAVIWPFSAYYTDTQFVSSRNYPYLLVSLISF